MNTSPQVDSVKSTTGQDPGHSLPGTPLDLSREDIKGSLFRRHPKSTFAVTLAAVVSTGLGVARCAQNNLADSWEARWGTLENPAYAPDVKIAQTLHPPVTFRMELESRLELARGLNTTKEGHDQRVSDLEQRPLQDSAITLPSEYSADEAVRFARMLVERKLGQSLPESVVLRIDESPVSFASGVADSWTEVALAEYSTRFPSPRDNFMETVGTLVHEIGHLLYRLAETKFTSLRPWEATFYETSVREEAVATLFRWMVAAQVHDPNVRFVLAGRGSIEALIERYFEGERDYGEIEGATLANAAIELADGDWERAWQILVCPEGLDPRLYEIIERDRVLYWEVLEAER